MLAMGATVVDDQRAAGRERAGSFSPILGNELCILRSDAERAAATS